MSRSLPLRLKVSLWMLANFAIVGSSVFGLLIWKFGFGWDAMVQGPAGNHIEDIAETIAGELREEELPRVSDCFSRHVPPGATNWFLFTVDKRQCAGEPVTPPDEVFDVLRIGTRRGPGPRGRPPRPEALGPPPPREGPEPASDQLAIGRFLVRTSEPNAYWIGIRVPVFTDGDRRRHQGALLVRAEGGLELAGLLGVPVLLAVAAGAAAVSVLLWLPLVGAMTRDLREVHRATERIAGGDFATRIAMPRRDEIGGLATAVNRLAGRLEAHASGQKRFLADVAHELGSPIACLQVLVGILESRERNGHENTVDEVREEVERMADLVNELLMFTQAGLRPRETEPSSVDLTTIVAAVLKRENAEGRIQVQLESGLVVRADEVLLARALGNLVRNALRYAAAAGPVTLTAQAQGEHVHIALLDVGPGVPAADLARLGEPFYRPETARARESGGVGLGLAIVLAAIKACGGEVRFSNRKPRGFQVDLTLDRAAADDGSPRLR